MNGPASPTPMPGASWLRTGQTRLLASINEREVTRVGSRFWVLTLHKTATGGYILECFLGAGRRPGPTMAATLAFADAAQLQDFLGAPEAPSLLAEGLLQRAAAREPELGPRSTP